MKTKVFISQALAAALIFCLGLPPAAGAHIHTWRADWAWDSNYHWHGCSDPTCRTLVPGWAAGYARHTYSSVNDPNCNVCGWVRAAEPAHTHTWSDGWNSDKGYHWYRCADPDCPGVVPNLAAGLAPHIYTGGEDARCSVCGRSRLVTPGHTHIWGADWNHDTGYHWRICTAPGCPGVVPSEGEGYGAHVYANHEDTVCQVCGRSRLATPGHTHIWGADWNHDTRYHWRICTAPGCPGVVPSEGEGYGAHVYANHEDTVCQVCGGSRFVNPGHTHIWGSGWSGNEGYHWHQCTAPGCPGVVPGEGEGYSAHIYDDSLDPDCNICGKSRIVLPPSAGDLNAPLVQDPDITIIGRGRVTVRPISPKPGDIVTVTLLPGEHYSAESLTVTAPNGEQAAAVRAEDGTWSFIRPGEKAKLKAVFLPSFMVCARDSSCPIAAYSDLSPGQWYHDGIHFCLDWEVMSGYDQTSFIPDSRLSGGMMAQTLYNLAGRPDVPGESGYTGSGAWYDAAVSWAVGAGMMNIDNGYWKFSPTEDVTREQLITMLWRYAGCPTVSSGGPPFADAADISPWAANAVRWAAEIGILHGRDGGLLDPQGKITRAESASILVRLLGEAPDPSEV